MVVTHPLVLVTMVPPSPERRVPVPPRTLGSVPLKRVVEIVRSVLQEPLDTVLSTRQMHPTTLFVTALESGDVTPLDGPLTDATLTTLDAPLKFTQRRFPP